jgi:hypothetical protein
MSYTKKGCRECDPSSEIITMDGLARSLVGVMIRELNRITW